MIVVHRKKPNCWSGKGSRETVKLQTDGVEGGGEGLPLTLGAVQEDQKKFEEPGKGLFQFMPAVTYPVAHHRKVKEKRKYNGDG
ncbi:hypothetical protein BTVI_148824 [Pitangus sulphuratus]|nr:hypothetical protein BTVI_148824 [Pitangus sulphuratus]